MLHAQDFADAFEILADANPAPGGGAIGIITAIAKMDQFTRNAGICTNCLEGVAHELAGDQSADVAFGIMIGVIAANNAAQKAEDGADEQRDRDQDAGQVLYVNEESTVLVRHWSTGQMEVAMRKDSDDVWQAPIRVERES